MVPANDSERVPAAPASPTGETCYVLAIDLGTSGPKVALATLQGTIVASGVATMKTSLLPGGGAEQDPEEWWSSIKQVARELMATSTVPREAVVAVCCTTQWSGTVPVDRQGRYLAPAIIWLDARGAPYTQRITGGPVKVSGYGLDKLLTWVRLTGGIPAQSGKDSIGHILYLKHERPEIYAAAYKFLEPKDYLNLRLTGRFAASFESMTLHWLTDNRDINNIAYSERLLRMAGVAREKLPEMKPSTAILGPILPAAAADLGLPDHVQVVMGTPDLHSAALGSGAIRDFEAHLYIGTSSWISCHVPFKKTDVLHNMAALPAAIPGRYFVVNEQEIAGAALRFLKENLLFHQDALAVEQVPADVYGTFDHIAAHVEAGSDGVIFTPWLNGERSPVDEHTLRGGFHNLALRHTREHLIRAVLEGVAYNSRWLLGHVERFAGRRFPAINVVGGGAQSDIWCQILADVLERPIRQVQDPIQANARGAAMLAGVALGATSFAAAADQVAIQRQYEPQEAHRATYDRLYRAFIDIYKKNRSIYGRLNR